MGPQLSLPQLLSLRTIRADAGLALLRWVMSRRLQLPHELLLQLLLRLPMFQW